MTAFPHEEWGTPTDSLLRSVVLQHLDTELPSLPRLGSNDLSWREVADALWLAHRLTPEADRGERDEPPTDPGEPSLPPLDQTGSDLPPVAPDRESGAQDWTPGPTQFIQPSVLDSDPAREAAPLRWPSAPTLPGALGIARALRPLMKTTQSPWKHVLDEEATATRAAQDSMWLPVWRPAPWHRLELALVVDTSPSMEIWRRTVEEFRQLLRRQGAFRDVRTYLVDCSNDTDDELVLHMEGPSGRPRSWRDLVDPTGRRLVLVLTDAVGMAWRNGCASRTLARWANRMPVAVGHLLPQRLWSWGGLSPQRTRLSAAAPGVPNRRLRMHSVDSGQVLDDARSHGGVVVPVLSLTPEWLSGWARLVAGVDGVSVETTAVVVHEGAADNGIAVESVEPESAEPGGACTPRERVLRFRTFASAEAFQLAGLLAAAPLNLPMMRLVQRVLLPGSGLPAVAEVLLGGILRKVPTSSSADDASAVVFEFYDGVRQELLSGERRDNTVRVARVLGDYAGRHLAVLRDYRDAVDDPDTAVDPELSAHTVPYLRVQEVVFRALSGRYARRAGVLRRSLDQWSHDGGTDSTERVIQASGNIHGAPLGVATPEVESDRQSVSIHDIGGVAVTATESTPLTDTSTVASSRSGEGNMTASSPSIAVSQERGMSGRPQIWGAIPLRNPDFVGRIDLLEQLQTRLTEPGTTVVLPEALHGMGGVGKSQTVVEYIYLHANEYDIIWW
ncbi:MAG: SAV_2336 N-terminal domain-related protein, partial [Sciscionella sp.]